MTRIIFYLFIKPLSLLPFRILYVLSDLVYLIMLIAPYRGATVDSNLRNSFPQKSIKEIRIIKRKFYRHFCDLIVESLKLFSISKSDATKRFKVNNPEFFEQTVLSNRSLILTGGHYQNWEYFAVATDPQIKHQLLGIYTPITNSFMERVFAQSRSKFGLVLVPKKQTRAYFEKYVNEQTVTTFAIDQSPRKHQKVYWITFLGQTTAVHFGAEKYAKDYNYPVIYGSAVKVKRGFYELTFQLLEENPMKSSEGKITEVVTKNLEQQILAAPEYWLWTHKRWKLKPPSIATSK
ncbi:MAG: hypothetical protein CMB80_14375 [Flammeovirgaceae bacterium]|nr:hypothetical protein [Flammeovirgaceae bacterium]MBR09387.1 hypothetical protein [Rickettsiales bacterium]MBR11482.1 hypothetical protein [Rickettsiales bacterium]HCX21429.1 hypothetical protein [Cytophagales bacterium]